MSIAPILEVCLSPALLHLYDTRDTQVVIIDIFRATSTICAALDNGAAAVVPVASVEECLQLTQKSDGWITAGERNGQVIPGLQYGNSPLDYTPDFIAGKTLALTTTNGTKLLHMVNEAAAIVAGSFLNIDTLCAYLQKENKKTLLACAAWKDRPNTEDCLFAGAVVHQLRHHFTINCDSAVLAASLFTAAQSAPSFLEFLKGSAHYRRLAKFGLFKDMEYCTTLNLHPVVPIFDGRRLVVAPAS